MRAPSTREESSASEVSVRVLRSHAGSKQRHRRLRYTNCAGVRSRADPGSPSVAARAPSPGCRSRRSPRSQRSSRPRPRVRRLSRSPRAYRTPAVQEGPRPGRYRRSPRRLCDLIVHPSAAVTIARPLPRVVDPPTRLSPRGRPRLGSLPGALARTASLRNRRKGRGDQLVVRRQTRARDGHRVSLPRHH